MCIRRKSMLGLAGGLLGAIATTPVPLEAGAFFFADETRPDSIAHPPNYSGAGGGGTVSIRVCINPSSLNVADLVIPVQNNINIYNRLTATTGNLNSGVNNNIPGSAIDFESVALHELGHCLGLGHVNAATESGLSGSNQNYTKATPGDNGVFDLDAGMDGVIGSSDDLRGDDVNLHWFRTSNNNPFTLDTTVDSSTYARDLATLPAGHDFAANADRAVAALLGVPGTEAVMQQGTYHDEAQRTLGHDDVATLRYAQSGVNENAGNRDDYTINLVYGGISTSNCDISIQMTNTSSFAYCSAGGTYVGGLDHFSLVDATMVFGASYNWFFNTDTVNQVPVLNAIGNRSLDENASLAVGISASDADSDNLSFTASGLPAFTQLTDHGNGTATLNINPGSGTAGTYPVTIDVQDDGLPVLTESETFDIVVNAPLADSDGDGISDADETLAGTNPFSVDSDSDGLADGTGGVVPVAILPDGIDSDGDGFVDGELDFGTLPLVDDTDGDQLADGLEVAWNSDPVDAGSWPAIADADLAPLGSPDGIVNAADLLIAWQIVSGDLVALPLQLAHGDLYPPGAPDGAIELSDLLLLQQLILTSP